MRTLSIFCLALVVTGGQAMAGTVDAKPSEVLKFREAAPARAPAAVKATEKVDKASAKAKSNEDLQLEAYFCIHCPSGSAPRAESINEQAEKIQKFAESQAGAK